MDKAIWIFFDLGIKGDYEGIYRWLDTHHADECGDSVAFLKFASSGDLLSEVKTSLQEEVEIDAKTRIYLVWSEGHKTKGRFIFGRRKAPAWAGYAPTAEASLSDEDQDAG